jgi:hypothetical protein
MVRTVKCVAVLSLMAMLVLLCLPASVQTQRVPTFYGSGHTLCSLWFFSDRPRDGIANDARSSPQSNQYYIQWVAGFISGYAYASTEPVGQAASDAIIPPFINRYCSEHPGDNFEAAAKALLTELQKR